MHETSNTISTSEKSPATAPSWLRRLGVAGFLFFLIKGLLWLIVPALLATRWITT